jgi:nucleolar complex protein 4 homolog B
MCQFGDRFLSSFLSSLLPRFFSFSSICAMSSGQFLQELSSEGLTFIQSDFSSFNSCFNSIKTVTQAILNPEKSMLHLVNIISKFIHYDDLKYYILKSLLHWLKVKRAENTLITDVYLMNAYNLLTSIRLMVPKKNPRKRKLDAQTIDALNAKNASKILFSIQSDEDKLRLAIMYEKMADVFASVWLTLISFKISVSLYRNILKIMDTRIMPHFRNPLTLSDFLIESYDLGGSASLLALSSLFILIQKCNL